MAVEPSTNVPRRCRKAILHAMWSATFTAALQRLPCRQRPSSHAAEVGAPAACASRPSSITPHPESRLRMIPRRRASPAYRGPRVISSSSRHANRIDASREHGAASVVDVPRRAPSRSARGRNPKARTAETRRETGRETGRPDGASGDSIRSIPISSRSLRPHVRCAPSRQRQLCSALNAGGRGRMPRGGER